MSSELAPVPPALLRRWQRVEQIAATERQIAVLQAQQRLAVAALYAEDRAGMSEKFVVDELACAWRRSSRQAQNRLDAARMFAAFPGVAARVADGTWLLDHADAVLGELLGCGLSDRDDQQRVLDLVLSRNVQRTPYELRVAVRTAVLVLFPDHAAQRAEQAARDRDVRAYCDQPGSAELLAHGPAQQVAAMMASLEVLSWPPAPGDERTAAQRRFDALYELVCGKARPGQWQAQVLVGVDTITGADELPAEIPGFGPVPAPVARELVAQGAELRRVVVDAQGQLVAVDPVVHRPDLSAPAPASGSAAWPVCDGDREDDDLEPGEPDPDAPSAADLAWLEEHTDRQQAYAAEDATRARAARAASRAARQRPTTAAEATPAEATPAEVPPANTPAERPAGPGWSEAALARALHRVRTEPVTSVDLSTDKYAVPVRLKRHLVLRDRTCVFPGCTRRAEQCDKDHLEPWPRGRTSEANLADECEHHHQAKHDRFRVQRLPDGTFRWTTPAGHTYDRPPRPVLDHLSYPRPPDTTWR